MQKFFGYTDYSSSYIEQYYIEADNASQANRIAESFLYFENTLDCGCCSNESHYNSDKDTGETLEECIEDSTEVSEEAADVFVHFLDDTIRYFYYGF